MAIMILYLLFIIIIIIIMFLCDINNVNIHIYTYHCCYEKFREISAIFSDLSLFINLIR